MENRESELLFAMLRSVICGEGMDNCIKAACTPELLQEVYTLAARHDLAHLVGQAVSKMDLPESQILTKLKQTAFRAVYRQVQLNYEYENICRVLQEAQIPFIPLKGTVLRGYYPEPWMRTSCDVDILVKEEMLDAAAALLVDKLGYRSGSKTDHDISLYCPSGAHIELHYDTIQERYAVNGCRDVLAQIWEDAKPTEPGSYRYCLSDEMFYFYHIAHMVKHFEVGGCGVRAYLDIWIMGHRMEHDQQKREELLREGGLLKFAQAAQALSEAWFSGAPYDEMTRAISDFILRASLYGNNENRAAIGQAKMGGKVKYVLLRRVFMPYDFLKAEYPILVKHKWLTPVYQVVRWIRMLCSGGLKRTVRELQANAQVKEAGVYSAADILKHLGL